MPKNTKVKSTESLNYDMLLGATCTIKILADELEGFSTGFGDPTPESVRQARVLVEALTAFLKGMPK
ncbi:hypothetical protein D3C85_1053270 [compost metagenome]